MTLLTVLATKEQALRRAAEEIAATADLARTDYGAAHIALAGGGTPRGAYVLLGRLVRTWAGVNLWFGDERYVPPSDPESNYRMVAESLLVPAAIDPRQVHRFSTEHEPDTAAAMYSDRLRSHVPLNDNGIPQLDLALLGLGEDCHTASLFPGSPVLAERDELCVAVHDAPKPPPIRLTMTLPLLQAAKRIIILACGEGKREAVAAVLAGPDQHRPASLLSGKHTELIVDQNAAPTF